MPFPISSLVNNEPAEGNVLMVRAEVRQARNGSDFLDATFQDATGTISGKFWNCPPDLLAGLSLPAAVRVGAMVETFRERLQLKIQTIDPLRDDEVDWSAIVPASAWQAQTLSASVRAHLEAEVEEAPLRRLLLGILDLPEVVEALEVFPAASTNHHAYRSGLIEHSLSMMRLASSICDHYARYYPGRLHRGLVLGGILLHDLGKIWELDGPVTRAYTDEGRLLGHIFMAARWVEDVAAELGDIPRELVVELQHLILSHHGRLEFGSPKRPKTLEAVVLHHIDKLDADLNQLVAAMPDPGWTGYLRNYERYMFNPSAYRQSWAQAQDGDAPEPSGPGVPRRLSNPASQGSGSAERPSKTSSMDAETYPFAPDAAEDAGRAPATRETPDVAERAPQKGAGRAENRADEGTSGRSAKPQREAAPPPPDDEHIRPEDTGSMSLFDGLDDY